MPRIRLLASLALGSALALTVLSSPPASAAETWSSPAALSTSGVTAADVMTVASSNGLNLVAAWREEPVGNRRVFASYSANGGVTWSSAQAVSESNLDIDEFTMAMSADGAVTAIAFDMNSGTDKLLLTTSTNGGSTWGSPVQLNTSGNSSNALRLAVSTSGSNMLASWSQSGPIVATTSSNAGATWGALATLSPGGASCDRVALAMSADGSKAYVGWVNQTVSPQSVQIARTSNGGTTWTTPTANERISNNPLDVSQHLELATSENADNVVAVWGTTANAVASNRSLDSGANWLSSPDIMQLNGNATFPKVVMSADAKRVIAMYQTTVNLVQTPVTRTSTDGGTTWSAGVTVVPSGSAATGQGIRISGDGSSAVAVWRQTTSVGVSRSTDGAGSWAASGSLDATGLNTSSASLASSSDTTWASVLWLQQFGTQQRVWAARTAPAPLVAAISPASGTTAGGTAITVSGTGFVAGATVTIGGAAATDVSVTSSTSITAKTPVATAGAANIVVTNVDGQSATLAGGFTYVTPSKKTMEPTKPMTFAGSVKPGKWKSVLSVPVTMNSGTNAKVTVTAKIGKKKASKKYFKSRTHKKHLQLWSSGKQKVTATVTVYAAETDTYSAYTSTRTYKIKKK